MKIDAEAERISLAIEDGSLATDKIAGARSLVEIWCQLDKLETFVEARLRLALHHLGEPPQYVDDEVPRWVEEKMESITIFRPHMGHAVDCAGEIMLAFLKLHPEAMAEVELMEPDTIVIRWDDVRGLRFMVSQPTLRWPAVNARAYFHPDPLEAPLACLYARVAHQLLELPYEKVEKNL